MHYNGFTLQDLVSYNEKHNEANGEENRDGTNNNSSWNCGAEGPTDDANILTLRAKQKRNLLATLLLSQGVPMISAGDSIGHTQSGNNNAYCQDNPTSWLNWDVQPAGRDLLQFVQRMIDLRRAHPIFHRRRFFQGRPIKGADVKDVLWLNPGGTEMTEDQWRDISVRCLGMLLSGEGLDETNARGQQLTDDTFLLLLNANDRDEEFTLPSSDNQGQENQEHEGKGRWMTWMDTSRDNGLQTGDTLDPGSPYLLQARSMVVLMKTIQVERRLNGNGKKPQ